MWTPQPAQHCHSVVCFCDSCCVTATLQLSHTGDEQETRNYGFKAIFSWDFGLCHYLSFTHPHMYSYLYFLNIHHYFLDTSEAQNDLLWTEQHTGPLIFELCRLFFREECRNHICLSPKEERGPGSPLPSCTCIYLCFWKCSVEVYYSDCHCKHYNETPSNVHLVTAQYFRI